MKLISLFLMVAILSACSLQVRPIGGVSHDELEEQSKSIERAFQIVDARLKKLEGSDEAK